MLTQNASIRKSSVEMRPMLFMTFFLVSKSFHITYTVCVECVSYITALLTKFTGLSSLSIPNVNLTPHASHCDEAERPALSRCSVLELDIYMYIYKCASVCRLYNVFLLKIALLKNNMTLREFKHSDPP